MVYIKYTIIKKACYFFNSILKAVHFSLLGECPPCSGWRLNVQNGSPAPGGVTGILELVLSQGAISTGNHLPSVSVSKASQLCQTYFCACLEAGQPKRWWTVWCLFWKTWVVFHTTPHKSGSKQNEPNDSSFIMLSALLGKERLHLGFSGPGLALNWEDAAHDLPITPQEHSTSNKNVMKRRGRILAACHAVPQLLHKNTWFRMPVFINPPTWVQSIQAWISHSSHLQWETPPCTTQVRKLILCNLKFYQNWVTST